MKENTPTFKVGDTITYLQIARERDYAYFPVSTQYTATRVTGVVKHIRDLNTDKLNYSTITKNPEIERSRYLVTIRTKEKIRKDYLGSMVEIEVLESVEDLTEIMQALVAVE